MEMWSNIHLMFCEGPHDAAFLNRLIKTELKFKKVEFKLSELPYPISNVIQQSFKTRAADDLRLDLAKKFFFPDYMLALDTVLIMIFNYGGSNRTGNMPPFLENVFALMSAAEFSGTGQPANSAKFAYTIFADADAAGSAFALNKISDDLGAIGGEPWLTTDWLNIEGSRAVGQESAFGNVAAYIWRKWTEDQGTLEDIVHDCLNGDANLQQTLEFLDTRFNWKASDGATPKQVCAIAAKRLKAAFCVEGQRDKPGMSLGVVLDQTALVRPEVIAGSAAVQDCLAFLRAWLTPVSNLMAA
jgi:hypothetical protein